MYYKTYVANGVALFEELMPGGEWAWYINVDALDMESPSFCVVAQMAPMLVKAERKSEVVGSAHLRYMHGIDALEAAFPRFYDQPYWASHHGLEESDEACYPELECEWKRVIGLVRDAAA